MTQPRAKEISAYRDGMSYPVRQKDFWNALARCAKACGDFNNLPNDATPEEKSAAWRKIVAPTSSAGTPVSSANDFPTPSVKGPIRIDYGLRVHIAADTFINHNCTILDTPVADVRIGKHCSLGPHVSIYSVGHNLNSDTHPRVSFRKPVTIEDGCWIGGNVTILGGVKIGAGSTIAAGSVVRSDIPPRSVAAGVPARVIRQIRPGEEHDAFPVASLHVALQIPSNHGGVEHMNEATRVRLDDFLGEQD